MMRRYELKDEEWKRIESLLPPERTGKRGRPAKSNRMMFNAMLWITRTGAQWRSLPDCYGSWKSVYSRFCKWRDDGTLEKVFHTLSADADMENLSIDSTCAKVHQSANGNKKGL
jgi:transposase